MFACTYTRACGHALRGLGRMSVKINNLQIHSDGWVVERKFEHAPVSHRTKNPEHAYDLISMLRRYRTELCNLMNIRGYRER